MRAGPAVANRPKPRYARRVHQTANASMEHASHMTPKTIMTVRGSSCIAAIIHDEQSCCAAMFARRVTPALLFIAFVGTTSGDNRPWRKSEKRVMKKRVRHLLNRSRQ